MSKNTNQNELLIMAKTLGILGGMGIYLAAVILICIYLGGLADDYLGAGGASKMAGILLGFPIAVYSIYRQIKDLQNHY